jgi:hypothetical protein
MRSTAVTVIMVGYSIGTSIGGPFRAQHRAGRARGDQTASAVRGAIAVHHATAVDWLHRQLSGHLLHRQLESVVFEQMHFARSTAAYAASAGSLLGALAGLALMRFTDGRGPAAVAFCPIVAIPVLPAVGLLEPAQGALLALAILSTMLIAGVRSSWRYAPSALRPSFGAGR